ncbi:MAG: polysaccharide biosynthesis protein [Nocardioidaceae bacterium]
MTAVAEAPSSVRVRSGAAVGGAMALANALQYVLQLVASRQLAPSAFGGFGALLGLGVLGAVPMLALQNVTARRVALAGADVPARRAQAGRLLLTAGRAAVAMTVLGLLAAPLVSAFLHVPLVTALWLALSLGPLAVAGAAQGVLQGRQRFGALAAVLLGVSALRVGGGVLGLALSPTTASGVAGTALGAVAAGLLAVAAVRSEATHSRSPGAYGGELAAAANGVLALLVLAGADLLLARHVLGGDASGRYAAGSLVARGCFWLPQFVAVLAVPRLASGEAALVRRAAALVAGFGVVEVVGALLTPASVVRLVLGPAYGSLAHVLALFAALGSCLAVLQLLLYAAIARSTRSVAPLLWAAVAAEAVLVLVLRPGATGVVATALACTAAALLAAAPAALREDR